MRYYVAAIPGDDEETGGPFYVVASFEADFTANPDAKDEVFGELEGPRYLPNDEAFTVIILDAERASVDEPPQHFRESLAALSREVQDELSDLGYPSLPNP